jgi:hypothetical protein
MRGWQRGPLKGRFEGAAWSGCGHTRARDWVSSATENTTAQLLLLRLPLVNSKSLRDFRYWDREALYQTTDQLLLIGASPVEEQPASRTDSVQRQMMLGAVAARPAPISQGHLMKLTIGILAGHLLVSNSLSATAQEFFHGKTINVYIGFSVGGGHVRCNRKVLRHGWRVKGVGDYAGYDDALIGHDGSEFSHSIWRDRYS